MKLICFFILQLNLFSGEINKFIRDFKSLPENQATQVSVSIRSADTGNEVYSHFSEINLPPASTLKLLTTATAFEYLGGGYKMETMIYSNGRVYNRGVSGDILIEGGGDPTFGSDRLNTKTFEQILKVLKENEIETIEGSIKILNNDPGKFPLSWLVGDIGNYYGAYAGGFNFAENKYTVYFNGGSKVGDPVGISNIHPFDTNWKIINKVSTGEANSGDQVNILNLPFSNDILLVGTVPLNARSFGVKGAIPNVEKIFTDSLEIFLKQNGITVRNKVFDENQQNEELGSVLSPDISTIAKETNFKSVNIFADGLANFMVDSEEENYDEFLKQFWKEKGIDLQTHRFYDGSGLAPQNTLSAKTLSSILFYMRNKRDFLESIPTMGKEGTVSNIGRQTEGRIKAKSGSINGTRNYAGYFTAYNGKKYVFSAFTSGFNEDRNSRAFLDSFFMKMLTIKE